MAEDKLWPVWYVVRRDEGVNVEEGFATEVDGALLDSRGGAEPMFTVFVDAFNAAQGLACWGPRGDIGAHGLALLTAK